MTKDELNKFHTEATVANAVELGHRILEELTLDVLDASDIADIKEVLALEINNELQSKGA